MLKSYKLLFVFNVDWFFLDHRLPIALALKRAGYKVFVAAANTGSGEKIEEYGFSFIPLPILEKSTGIGSEFRMWRSLYKLYKKLNPDLVHHVTIRPVIYGSIVSRLANVHAAVNEMTGMGYLYINHSIRNRTARAVLNFFFRRGFKHPASRLLLQNMDDVRLILDNRLIEAGRAVTLGGTGVDVQKFKYHPEISDSDTCHIVYTGRMLWDKGIGELAEAVKKLHEKGHSILLHLYGAPYEANPKSIPSEQLESWNREPFITYHGFQKNMVEALQKANIVCLPSYREGLPKTLLEAAATGRVIVTTDVPGCREVVEEGVNGYLVPPKNIKMLADRLEKLIDEPELREAFGKAGRGKAVAEFSEERVVKKTLALYEELLK